MDEYFCNIGKIFLNNLYLEDSRQVLEKILQLMQNCMKLQFGKIKLNVIGPFYNLPELKTVNSNMFKFFEGKNANQSIDEEIKKNQKIMNSLEAELEEIKFNFIKKQEAQIEKAKLIDIDVNSLRNENIILKSKISRLIKQKRTKLFINPSLKNHAHINLNENEEENLDLTEKLIFPTSTRYISNASSIFSDRKHKDYSDDKNIERSTFPSQMISPINNVINSASKSIKTSLY